MPRKPILCVDFDGVIHSYTSGWKGIGVITDPPVPGAIEWLKEADQHFKVMIYSTRSATLYGRLAMNQYIYDAARAVYGPDFGGDIGWLERIEFPDTKPPAFVSIDDRALLFEGTFPDMATLLAFKPWNKQ